MADIFISYKREDRARIAPLARALEARGYTVWWDLELVPSQKFERQIFKELDAARCVIVVWTTNSIDDMQLYASDWINTEANSGDARGILLPVQLDADRTHRRHRDRQYADLIGWSGEAAHPGLAALLKGVEALTGVRLSPEQQELADWQAAERAETAADFERFLDAYPQSRFADIARSRIAELQEVAAWQALGAAPTIAALAAFLRRYPSGRFADEAEAKIRAMELASARATESPPLRHPGGAAGAAQDPGSPEPPLERSLDPGRGLRPPQDDGETGVISKKQDLPKWAIPAAGVVAVVAALLIWSPWSPPPPPAAEVVAQRPEGAAAVPPSAVPATPPASGGRESFSPGQTFRDCADCPEMVVIPAGSFVMGSPSGEVDRETDEGPQRTVSIRAFAAGKFEVTFDEWAACVAGGGCRSNANPGDQGWGRGRRPVINVSWNDAQEYVQWLSSKTGQRYRLLTEAEWEYATRGKTSGTANEPAFWWGNSINTNQANYDGNGTYNGGPKGEYRQRTMPVGVFSANPFGLYDVHGNVWEWVQDCYVNTYSGAPVDGSAVTAGDCSRRVLRGGSWSNNPQLLRSAIRSRYLPTYRYSLIGFRLARTVFTP